VNFNTAGGKKQRGGGGGLAKGGEEGGFEPGNQRNPISGRGTAKRKEVSNWKLGWG